MLNFTAQYLTPFTPVWFLSAFQLYELKIFFTVLVGLLRGQLRFWSAEYIAMEASTVGLGDSTIWYRGSPQSVPGKEGTENKFPGISSYGPYAPTSERVKARASCSWEYKLLEPLWKIVWSYRLKLKIRIPHGPKVPFLGLHSKKCLPMCTKRHVQECS